MSANEDVLKKLAALRNEVQNRPEVKTLGGTFHLSEEIILANVETWTNILLKRFPKAEVRLAEVDGSALNSDGLRSMVFKMYQAWPSVTVAIYRGQTSKNNPGTITFTGVSEDEMKALLKLGKIKAWLTPDEAEHLEAKKRQRAKYAERRGAQYVPPPQTSNIRKIK